MFGYNSARHPDWVRYCAEGRPSGRQSGISKKVNMKFYKGMADDEIFISISGCTKKKAVYDKITEQYVACRKQACGLPKYLAPPSLPSTLSKPYNEKHGMTPYSNLGIWWLWEGSLRKQAPHRNRIQNLNLFVHFTM